MTLCKKVQILVSRAAEDAGRGAVGGSGGGNVCARTSAALQQAEPADLACC